MQGVVTFIAQYVIFLSAIVVAWVFLTQTRARKKDFIIAGLVGALVALALAKIGGHLYYNPRPFVEGGFVPYFSHGADNGFPSEHTLLAAFFTFLAFRYSGRWGWVLLVLAIAIGLARVQAGVHHLLDVLGGFAFAAAGVWFGGLVATKISGQKHLYTAKKSHD